jgi:cellulose 1,4-beta-cellobiosidase
VRFTGTTVLAPGQSTGDISLRFNKTTFANFNETNDYSRINSTSNYADTVRLTAFRNGSIIWGTPP